MQVIVPLAGPDFVAHDGSLKALSPLNGAPLLRHVLESRPWAPQIRPQRYTFVMLDRAETRAFAQDHLAQWYPGARVVFISDVTRGAALSALAGTALTQDMGAPLIIDLADILYQSQLDPEGYFDDHAQVGGVAMTFEASDPLYSYLRFDDDGVFVEAAEKRVISNIASAGTYLFRSLPVYLRSLAHALETPKDHTYKNLFFVCPLFNGVLAQGKTVDIAPVHDVTDIKMEKR